MKSKSGKAEVVPRLFASREAWAVWLEKNHRKPEGLWLRLAKKGSGMRSVSYGEALEVALAYGWIDGRKKPESEEAWLQRFVPRSARSIWSKINREKALALMACADEGGRVGSGGAGQGMREVGVGVRFSEGRCGAWGLSGGFGWESAGSGFLSDARFGEPVCGAVSDSNGEEGGDAGAEDSGVRGNAGEGREDSRVTQ